MSRMVSSSPVRKTLSPTRSSLASDSERRVPKRCTLGSIASPHNPELSPSPFGGHPPQSPASYAHRNGKAGRVAMSPFDPDPQSRASPAKPHRADTQLV